VNRLWAGVDVEAGLRIALAASGVNDSERPAGAVPTLPRWAGPRLDIASRAAAARRRLGRTLLAALLPATATARVLALAAHAPIIPIITFAMKAMWLGLFDEESQYRYRRYVGVTRDRGNNRQFCLIARIHFAS